MHRGRCCACSRLGHCWPASRARNRQACPPEPWRRWANRSSRRAAGKWRGRVDERHPRLQRHSLRRRHEPAPFSFTGRAGAVDRRSRRARVRSGRAAAVERRPGDQRRLPASERLDAGAARQREAAGHGLVSRRRVFERHQQRARDRRRAPQPPRRRRRRDRQPSPQCVRLSASRRVRSDRSRIQATSGSWI